MVKGAGPVRENDYINGSIDTNKINYLLRYIRVNMCICQLQLLTMKKHNTAVMTKKWFSRNISGKAGHKI